ncbi:hypothetical protein [Streptomyces hypolithicus]
MEIPAPRGPAPSTAPDDGMAMRMTAAAIDHGRAVLPVLVAEIEAPIFIRNGAGSELAGA